MTAQASRNRDLQKLRIVLGFFIAALVVSGLTAFPLLREMEWLASWRGLAEAANLESLTGIDRWVVIVRDGLRDTYARHPWVAYGTDWLAFAHLAIAVFFIGPVINPVRNVWVLWAGLIACAGIIPLAVICGSVRGIPLGWRIIDCSFGVFGALPLAYCLRLAKRLEVARGNWESCGVHRGAE